MKRNLLPPMVAISMTKSQFCFCTGMTPYKLRQKFNADPKRWERLGYHKWDKMLMPNVVQELLAVTGLRIDLDLYTQYVAAQRGVYIHHPEPVQTPLGAVQTPTLH